jgi:hypothetical protein
MAPVSACRPAVLGSGPATVPTSAGATDGFAVSASVHPTYHQRDRNKQQKSDQNQRPEGATCMGDGGRSGPWLASGAATTRHRHPPSDPPPRSPRAPMQAMPTYWIFNFRGQAGSGACATSVRAVQNRRVSRWWISRWRRACGRSVAAGFAGAGRQRGLRDVRAGGPEGFAAAAGVRAFGCGGFRWGWARGSGRYWVAAGAVYTPLLIVVEI